MAKKEKETSLKITKENVGEVALPQSKVVSKSKVKKTKKTGPVKRIPEDWKVKLLKLDPINKKRLTKAVAVAKANDLEEVDLLDLMINEAIRTYLDSFEKKHKA